MQQAGKDHADPNPSCDQHSLGQDDDHDTLHEDQCQARPHQQHGHPHDGGRFRQRQTSRKPGAYPSRREHRRIVLPVFTSWQVRSYGVGARIRYNVEQPSWILILND